MKLGAFFQFRKVHFEFVRLATEKCGLKSELVGKLGKRTRFQQKELAQLVLDTVGFRILFLNLQLVFL